MVSEKTLEVPGLLPRTELHCVIWPTMHKLTVQPTASRSPGEATYIIPQAGVNFFFFKG